MNENDGKLEVDKVVSPDKEALKLAQQLRAILPGVGLSVYAEIDRQGRRVLEVVADHPTDEGQYGYSMRYNADKPLDRIAPHAAKRIKAHYEL